MSAPPPPVLLNLIAAGLFLGLVVVVAVGSPPRRLGRPLLAFNVLVLVYILGDAITLTSTDMLWEQLGIAILYSGSIPASAACWVIALRYAEVQGAPFRWAGRGWVWGPVALAAAAWLVLVSNPWHGRVLVPVIGAHNVLLWPWYPLACVGYVLSAGAVALLGALAWRAPDSYVRRGAAVMAIGIAATLLCNFLSYRLPSIARIDLTVVGLCLTGVVFLYGAYRTRLFSLLPVAYREVLRHDPDGVLLAIAEGRLLAANPAAQRLLGLRPPAPDANVYALLAERLRCEDGAPLAAEALRERLWRHSTDAAGTTLRLAGPGERWLQVAVASIPSDGKRPLAVSVRLRDVSERQRAAAALQRARDELERRVVARTAELRESEERYRLVSQLSSDASFALRVDPQGTPRPEWYTQAMTRLTGYTAEQLEAAGWDTPLHPDDRERVARFLEPMVDRGGSVDIEFRIRTRDDEVKWLEFHAATVERLADGSARLVGALRDITERRRAEEERGRLQARMEETQRLESLGVLSGGIAHDFNNLLAVVLGNSTLALRQLAASSPLRPRLERIRSAGQYAAQLTDQMLTYAGRATPKLGRVDLSGLVEEMLDLLRASVGKACWIETELAEQLAAIQGDGTQIRQVVMNLVGNASEASGEAGGPVRVQTGVTWADRGSLSSAVGARDLEPGEYVFLEVSDRGDGMDEAIRNRIFEPFFTTRVSGRGLGLAVVLGIVRGHGGVIQVESARGSGTRFRVLLPRAGGVAATREPAPLAASAPRDAVVLVADDDEDVLELASLFLGRDGFRVRTAGGGREAIEHFEAHAAEIDAVVLDLSMPGVDGRQALEAIRARRADVPVVITSGFNEAMAGARVADLPPPIAFLRKPYEPEELAQRLLSLLRLEDR